MAEKLTKMAIIGFSFGYRLEGGRITPGQSNKALAKVVEKMHRLIPDAYIILQWKIADCLPDNVLPDLKISKHRHEGDYLDTEEVIEQALEFLKGKGVEMIYVIAKPSLHLFKCKQLLSNRGYEILTPVFKDKVPYDKQSAQWWTRGPIRLSWYAIKQKLFGSRGM